MSKSQSLINSVCALSLLALSACNEGNNNQTQSLGEDWVDDGLVTNPAPTAPPSPAPTTEPAPTAPTTDLYTGPADVAKYVQKFIDDARLQGVDVLPDMKGPKLEIRVASLDSWGSSTIGLCETSGSMRRVTFDPDFWNQVSETQRELLAHHEFGHCILYRGHRSDTLSGGAYASIMYPIIMSSSMYTNNRDYYLEELFSYGAMDPGGAENVHICGPDEVH